MNTETGSDIVLYLNWTYIRKSKTEYVTIVMWLDKYSCRITS